MILDVGDGMISGLATDKKFTTNLKQDVENYFFNKKGYKNGSNKKYERKGKREL